MKIFCWVGFEARRRASGRRDHRYESRFGSRTPMVPPTGNVSSPSPAGMVGDAVSCGSVPDSSAAWRDEKSQYDLREAVPTVVTRWVPSSAGSARLRSPARRACC